MSPPRAPLPRRQRGAVLIVSLILLVVLTLLGVASMNTTQLEEKMAANAQISAVAFHAAETGISEAFTSTAAWDVTGSYATTVGTGDGPDPDSVDDAQVDVRTDYLGQSAPPLGSLYSASSFTAYHFDFVASGCTDGTVTDGGGDPGVADECEAAGGLVRVIHGGAYQIAPNIN